jgi:Fur family ferric uptake transcriptional regulator
MPMKPRLRKTEDFRKLLSDSGIRVTEQRLVILCELERLKMPISHPELTERLAGPSLDRATIYRNLLSLAEAGLLVRTQLGDGVWRYELPRTTATKHGAHPHFVCTDCGDIACLPESTVTLSPDVSGRVVAEVQLRGQCGECSDP